MLLTRWRRPTQAAVGAFLAFAGLASAQPSVVITRNGLVYDQPLYPYIGHGYHFDLNPGDNDLPALRAYAARRGVFDGIDLSADWKDREFEMMKAIVYHTSHHLPWSDASTDPTAGLRALRILSRAEAQPEWLWGCGDIAAAAIGLAQAHGIPARFVNGRHVLNPDSGDFCLEMFSTRYNRWVFFMAHCNAWFEDVTLGPLGVRELHEWDLAGAIQYEVVDGLCRAIPHPPLAFMPADVCRSPVQPHYTAWWWSGMFHHFHVGWRTQLNGDLYGNNSVFNDNFLNEYYQFDPPGPVMPIDDLNISYPLNNVEASAELAGTSVVVTLRNNLFEFDGYQIREDDGPWIDWSSGARGGPVAPLVWHPTREGCLAIRGVNVAGVHSPDVLIDYRWNQTASAMSAQ